MYLAEWSVGIHAVFQHPYTIILSQTGHEASEVQILEVSIRIGKYILGDAITVSQ